jgi:hypothetical protein
MKTLSVIHLNGLAYAECENLKGLHEKNLHSHILSLYDNLIWGMDSVAGGLPLLTFAWENLKEDFTLKRNNLLENAIKVAKETHALVICGTHSPFSIELLI